jgi:hypothetical protein
LLLIAIAIAFDENTILPKAFSTFRGQYSFFIKSYKAVEILKIQAYIGTWRSNFSLSGIPHICSCH